VDPGVIEILGGMLLANQHFTNRAFKLKMDYKLSESSELRANPTSIPLKIHPGGNFS
jgi:hypothetical protein